MAFFDQSERIERYGRKHLRQFAVSARLSLDERVFIESSLGTGCSVADVAQRLGRDRSTVHRELARCAGRAGYDAGIRWAACRQRARGRDESERPSWRPIGCWPPRSMSA